MLRSIWVLSLVLLQALPLAFGSPSPAREALQKYWIHETTRLADATKKKLESGEAWKKSRNLYRKQLQEMLGLDPFPAITPLNAVVSGAVDENEFTVENLYFESIPGLYVTGNLYVPKQRQGKLPAILYVCGHGGAMRNGISFGNKTVYSHHGVWFARHGYVCLVIDTIQLGEIQGLHHGTYREGMWWWNSRGYTPAGVEAWNSIRAIDYLQSRAEVDPERIGMTGRSGGGAYSWWAAALDDRVKVVAPVAGITDLHNHVVDGTVEGHCDCMFMVNTYQWDYSMIPALVAPRPLLIGNTDKDPIFPLDGVVRIHADVARVYKFLGATNHLGLLITEGPHKDTQDLQVPVLRWFNRFLKGEDSVISTAADRKIEMERLRVFATLPPGQRNTKIQESFVEQPRVESSRYAKGGADQLKEELREKCFAGWPAQPSGKAKLIKSQVQNGLKLTVFEFEPQPFVRLRLYKLDPSSKSDGPMVVRILDEKNWRAFIGGAAETFSAALADEKAHLANLPDAEKTSPASETLKINSTRVYVSPRGIGLDSWGGSERVQTHIRRRFMLLGQTLDGMRVWDIRSALQQLELLEVPKTGVVLSAEGTSAVNALYAALWEPNIRELHLTSPPASHSIGPDYLNILRVGDIPLIAAKVGERSKLILRGSKREDWALLQDVLAHHGLSDHLQITESDSDSAGL